jgi:hypothetical protein
MKLLKETLFVTYGSLVFARSVPMTPCEEAKQVALERLNQYPNIADLSVPQCMPDGTYPKMYCNWLHCWCQNTTTGEQKGDFFPAGPNSANKCEPVKTRCQEEQKNAIDRLRQGTPIADFEIPPCMPDGSYPKMRCGRTGDCWCQNTNTGEREGEYFPKGVEDVAKKCELFETCLERQIREKEMFGYIILKEKISFPNKQTLLSEYAKNPNFKTKGRFTNIMDYVVSKCNEDGSYPKYECSGFDFDVQKPFKIRRSKCWCQNTTTGEMEGEAFSDTPFNKLRCFA